MKESMKKSVSRILCMTLAMGLGLSASVSQTALAAQIDPSAVVIEETVGESSGACGIGTNWTFRDGTLTISGNGIIAEWETVSYTPWYDIMSQIRNVVICEGVTNVGRASFCGASNLTSVTIPMSVTSISASAFQNSGLNSVTIPPNVASVGDKAFYNCPNLREVKFQTTNCRFVGKASCITNSNNSGSFGGTIYGAEGSTAQQMAKELNYNFAVLNDIPKPATTTTTTTT